MLQIRKADCHDASIIALLARVTFDESFGHLFSDRNDLLAYFERTFHVDKLTSSLQKETNLFWIALWDNLPVGYAKLKLHSTSEFVNGQKVCQLQKIYILKDFHSKKIGYQLQNQLLDKARQLDFEKIWLSVYDGNQQAINFYEKNDFKKVGEHVFQIGREVFDFWVMVRSLKY